MGNFTDGSRKSAAAIVFRDEKGGVKVLNVYIHLLRFSKHARGLWLIEFALQLF